MNIKQNLLTAVALTLPLAGAKAQCTNPPPGLVGWWSGDGHFFDLVGANHGTPVGGVSFAPGEVGRAFAAGSAGKAPPPTFTASPVSGGVLLSWPASAAGYELVSRALLAAGPWEAVTNEPSLDGDEKKLLLPATPPVQRFFRFSKPGPSRNWAAHFRN